MKKILSIILALLVVALPVTSAFAFIYETHTSGESTSFNTVYGASWYSQTFTATSNHTVDNIWLELARKSGEFPGTITVSLRATAAGAPTGADLASGSIDGDTELHVCGCPSYTAAWANIVFSSSYDLVSGTKYALIIRAPSGDASNRLWVVSDSNASDQYAGGGQYRSADSGSTWPTSYPNDDIFFQIEGVVGTSAPLVTTSAPVFAVAGDNITFYGSVFDSGTDNVTITGFQVALASEAYSGNISENTSLESGPFSMNVSLASVGINQSGSSYKVKAYAINSIGIGEGQSYTFTYQASPTVSTGGASEVTSGSTVTYQFLGDITASGWYSPIVSIRGVQMGYSDGAWESTLQLEDIACGGSECPASSWNGSIGQYVMSTTALTANTTYYYRAFAQVLIGTTLYTGYGSTANFTTGQSGTSTETPVVTTDGLGYVTIDGAISLSGTIVSSSSSVIEWGFRYSKSDPTLTTYASSSRLGTHPVGIFSDAVNFPLAPGEVVYARAFARNSLGNIGLGNILSYTVPALPVGPGGLTIVNDGATVNGNTATLRATVTNPGGISLSRYGFSWGVTSLAEGTGSYNAALSGTASSLSHIVSGLNPAFTYWYKAGVLSSSGSWYWSTATSFTTGASIPDLTGGGPIVVTNSATNIGLNGFTANGELTSLGTFVGSAVSELGFSFSTDLSIALEDWQFIGNTGNFSTGSYNAVITVSEPGVTVYYAARAENQYAPAWGDIYYVTLVTTSGGGGNSNTAEPSGTDNAMAFFVDWMRRSGLDNTMGRWLLLVICQLLVGAGFGLGIAVTDRNNRLVRSALGIAWIVCAAAVLGGFIFSGFLGLVPVIVVIALVVGFVIIFLNRIVERGRA